MAASANPCAVSPVSGGAEAVKSTAGRVQDTLSRENAQNEHQRLQERQREQPKPEEKEKESGSAGSGSAPQQMKNVDPIDELLKYTDYAMLSELEKEEVRARQARSEV